MTTLIIDGNSLFSNAYYASQSNNAKAGDLVDEFDLDGAETSPTKVMINILLALLDTYGDKLGKKVDDMLVCWDGKSKTDKKREPKPDDFYDEMSKAKQSISDLFGGAQFRSPDHEAEDSVATAVRKRVGTGTIYVVSGDKDVSQLQAEEEDVHCYCLNRKRLLTNKDINTKWVVNHPSQLSMQLAVVGDTVDNIPGVRRWGVKKWEKLMDGVLTTDTEALYDHLLSNMNSDQAEQFNECVNVTLLDASVPGVPEPLPVSFASDDLLDALGFNSLRNKYAAIRAAYQGESTFAEEEF